MSILDQLRADYAQFPKNQSYDLYAEDVFFKDPLNQFRGVQRYREMIGFMETYFLEVSMELHQMEQVHQTIHTRWTLRWQAPLPWRPQMAISGTSQLQLNDQGLICTHIDAWDCSRWAVLRQLFGGSTQAGNPL
ncbi:DUF2358 domain-containing protein [Lyngbya confervoides]|uniref:DUF2358 domain-containing protein n=1 Tax=Lyngbya confervoides BDU141951 TaxID=1574623 RepID=A0ABD4SXI5_9CYAN|nr:DUF2358 domain-containing protein [Lyngbya confervoides]MCM1981331.1 DUF2358 domain-containing protein [Lyngbya confervoides BDU141951]